MLKFSEFGSSKEYRCAVTCIILAILQAVGPMACSFRTPNRTRCRLLLHTPGRQLKADQIFITALPCTALFTNDNFS